MFETMLARQAKLAAALFGDAVAVEQIPPAVPAPAENNAASAGGTDDFAARAATESEQPAFGAAGYSAPGAVSALRAALSQAAQRPAQLRALAAAAAWQPAAMPAATATARGWTDVQTVLPDDALAGGEWMAAVSRCFERDARRYG